MSLEHSQQNLYRQWLPPLIMGQGLLLHQGGDQRIKKGREQTTGCRSHASDPLWYGVSPMWETVRNQSMVHAKAP